MLFLAFLFFSFPRIEQWACQILKTEVSSGREHYGYQRYTSHKKVNDIIESKKMTLLLLSILLQLTISILLMIKGTHKGLENQFDKK